MASRRLFLQSSAAAAAYLASGIWTARADDAPGVTATEIKVGQTMPYSGPLSSFGVLGKSESAYFKMINDQGGVNGRKINLISVDDGYSPPKTVEQVRRLVEQEGVAFIFGSIGTPTNVAVREYLNDNEIPQLFVSTGAAMFADPVQFPWTMGWTPNYQTEASIYGRHILKTKPDAKIAVLYQNDDFGKDYLIGLKAALGADQAGMIVKEASYEVSEPSVDSQIVTLQDSGADVLLIAASPKFAAQAIRRSADLGWKASRYLSYISVSVASVMKPAGLENGKGVIAAAFSKSPTDPRWKDDEGMNAWKAFADKYLTPKDFIDANAASGFTAAAILVQALRQCGDDFSRANVMRQAANLKDLELPLLLPGVKINTSPTNYRAIRRMRLQTFNGESWEPFGELMEG